MAVTWNDTYAHLISCKKKDVINQYVYADAIRDLLINRRGKFRNVMTTGPTNCGKTFILKPLKTIYNAFSDPAREKYAWVGVDKEEEIILEDLQWSSELIY